MTQPTDEDIDRRTVLRTPLPDCTRCGQPAWKRTCLATGAGGGLSLSTVVYRECGCGRVEVRESMV